MSRCVVFPIYQNWKDVTTTHSHREQSVRGPYHQPEYIAFHFSIFGKRESIQGGEDILIDALRLGLTCERGAPRPEWPAKALQSALPSRPALRDPSQRNQSPCSQASQSATASITVSTSCSPLIARRGSRRTTMPT